MDIKKWLNDRYTFYEEIFEFKESYCLDFCLKEDLKEFIDLSFGLNIPFTFYPQYKIAIQKVHLKKLIELVEKKNNKFIHNPQLMSEKVFL